jgi:uncharacterized protein YbaA (DUF1428 family)
MYADKATADRLREKMMNDPAKREMDDIPFDGERMIFGGIEPIVLKKGNE